jgi:glycosyltransferase involved in cell wall biosynthesis
VARSTRADAPTSVAALRVHVVDPPAYTPPYDHALCAALARAGAEVTLVTTRFAHGDAPRPEGYARQERFYPLAPGARSSRLRRAARLAQHVPGMLLERRAARHADVVHLQWVPVPPLDLRLLPRRRPLVLTAHDVLPREPRRGQVAALRALYARLDAVVVHSRDGRRRLVEEAGVEPRRVHVIPHGVLDHLARVEPAPLEPELAAVEGPVVLAFGLLRPYKGLDVLVEAWRGITGAELWIAGMPRMDVAPLRAAAPAGVRLLARFLPDPEAAALLRRADLVVLPYRQIDQSGVLFTALGLGKPLLLSAVGGFPEVAETGAAELVPPGDPAALHAALGRLIADEGRRAELAAGARAAARGPYAWDGIARAHLELYRTVGA